MGTRTVVVIEEGSFNTEQQGLHVTLGTCYIGDVIEVPDGVYAEDLIANGFVLPAEDFAPSDFVDESEPTVSVLQPETGHSIVPEKDTAPAHVADTTHVDDPPIDALDNELATHKEGDNVDGAVGHTVEVVREAPEIEQNDVTHKDGEDITNIEDHEDHAPVTNSVTAPVAKGNGSARKLRNS